MFSESFHLKWIKINVNNLKIVGITLSQIYVPVIWIRTLYAFSHPKEGIL